MSNADLIQRVEGQIWAAVRAAVESHAATIVEATMAGKYEIASACFDKASREIADGILARPEVQQALLLAASAHTATAAEREACAKIAEGFDIEGVRNHGTFIANQIRAQSNELQKEQA